MTTTFANLNQGTARAAIGILCATLLGGAMTLAAVGPAMADSTAPNSGAAAWANAVSAQYSNALRYPAQAAQRGISGQTQLSMTVGADKAVTDVSVTRSSGNAQLDAAAVSAARRLAALPEVPAYMAGKPVKVSLTANFGIACDARTQAALESRYAKARSAALARNSSIDQRFHADENFALAN